MTLPFTSAFVTGASGFIGRHLCRALAAAGIHVHALVVSHKERALFPDHGTTTVHQSDITNAPSLTTIIAKAQPEIVFHLAAYGTPTHERDIAQMTNVNIIGTQNTLMAAAAAKCRLFIQTGSVKEYAPSRTPITESTPLLPWDHYAATKTAASFFCRLASEKLSQPVTVLRFSPAYGPGESSSRFIPTAIHSALTGTPFTLSVSSLVRNFTYIDDVVTAFLLAATHQHASYEEFNIGSAEVRSFDDVLTAVENATQRRITRVVVPPLTSRDDSWVIDSRKAQQQLSWEAHVSLSAGIAQTAEWYRAQVMAPVTQS